MYVQQTQNYFKKENSMKAEQHIHFLSDLLQQINELHTLVEEYCDEVMWSDDEEYGNIDGSEHRNEPF